MSLAQFLNSLFVDGRVRVPAAIGTDGQLLEPPQREIDQAVSVLTNFEAEYRNDLPGNPPNISTPSMLWAALIVFRAASFLAHRDIEADIIRTAIRLPCPEPVSPNVCYSVDLTFRFLPDLVRLAKAASPKDPLVENLRTLCREWPLSSVGVNEVDPADVSPFWADECLRKLYVDRIIATKDRSRLSDSRVHDAVRAAIGVHEDLCPEFSEPINVETTSAQT